MDKSAISVTVSNAEPEVRFLAGMPESSPTAISRPEVLAIPRRVPKTMSLKSEGGVPEAIAEGGREMVDQLERKFGEAFVRGFMDELEKSAAGNQYLGDLVKKFRQQKQMGQIFKKPRVESTVSSAVSSAVSSPVKVENVARYLERPRALRAGASLAPVPG